MTKNPRDTRPPTDPNVAAHDAVAKLTGERKRTSAKCTYCGASLLLWEGGQHTATTIDLQHWLEGHEGCRLAGGVAVMEIE
jgi:hypothetical protein